MRIAPYLLALCLLASPAFAGLKPTHLRCEYRANPLAVDSERPRLSWWVESRERGQRQTAYQILAGTRRGASDLWDSGKRTSSETVHVPYSGRALAGGQRVFWRVRVWDVGGRASRSESAEFTRALDAREWRSSWIEAPKPPPIADAPNLKLASWIWRGDGPTPPRAVRWFRTSFTREAGEPVRIAITADDSYQVFLNGREVSGAKGNSWKEARIHDLAATSLVGANILEVRAENDEPGPAGVLATLKVGSREYPTDIDWTASADRQNWERVAVVGAYGTPPWGEPMPGGRNAMTPPPTFRGRVRVEKKLNRALLCATALGVYDLTLNGRKFDTDVLSPGWTDFSKRVYFHTYDVTKSLKTGENVLDARLGDGWYASYLAFTGRRRYYGGDPKLRIEVRLEYADGTVGRAGTDAGWKWATGGISSADLLMGTEEDTRVSEADWKPVAVATEPPILLQPHPGEPIRPWARVRATSRSEPKPKTFVYNLGQNLTGWARLSVVGKPGQKIALRHAERLNPDGTAYFTNLRAAKATDTFVLRGGKQTIEPKFTFHGFQYIEVTGLDNPPAPKDVFGIAVGSEMAKTLRFETDNPLLNKLVSNIDWGWRGNSLDVPTDCPQRDERAGWTGDVQVFAKTAMLLRDDAGFFSKWLTDLIDDGQDAEGALPDVAPYLTMVGRGNAAWEDSGVIVAYRMYEMFGDTEAVRAHWPGLTKYMEHLAKVAPTGIRQAGAYGDWLLLDQPQLSPVLGTAYYFRSADLMATLAEALGKPDEAREYRALAKKVKGAFNEKFVSADGTVSDGGSSSQTFYALTLEWELLPPALRPLAAKKLEASLAARGGHLATGFIGTPVLLFALDKAGRSDLASDLVLKEDYPSWLNQVKLGSTTMWERWDGWTPEKGFQDPVMNSFNHYWLGCVQEWLTTRAAGIDTESPGWKTLDLRPVFPAKLNRVSCTYDSIRGRVTSRWRRERSGAIRWEITIPANVVATAHLPGGRTESLDSGRHILTLH